MQSNIISHVEAIKIARSHERPIAWPTVVMAVLVSCGFWVVAYLAATGMLSLWWALPINIFLAYSNYTPVHEACHRNVVDAKHRHAWLNDAVGVLCSSPLLGSFHLHQLTHLAHHAHTNDPERDPDQWMVANNVFSLLWRSLSLAWVHNVLGVKLARKRSDGKKRLTHAAIHVSLWISMVVLLAWRFDTTAALLTTVVAALTAGVILAIVFDWLPHHPHSSRERWEHTRVVTFVPGLQGALDQLLYGQTYHLVHHLYPRVPFYEYKNVFKRLRDFFEHSGAQIYPAGSRRD
jgi:beta-carotene hydroxylase